MRDIRDLFGIGRDRIYWTRPVVIAIALTAATFIESLLWPLISAVVRWEWGDVWERLGGNLPNILPFLAWIYGDVVMVLLVVVALRWFRPWAVALPIAAVGYLLLARPVVYFLFKAHYQRMLADDPDTLAGLMEVFAASWWSPSRLTGAVTFVLLTVLGMVAVKWLRPWWLGLGVGLIAANTLSSVVFTVLREGFLEDGPDIEQFATNLLGSWLGVGVFLALVVVVLPQTAGPERETRDAAAAAGRAAVPRLSKGAYVGGMGGMFLGSLLFAVLGTVAAATSLQSGEATGAFGGLLALAFVCAIAAAVIWVRLIYLMWAAIQDDQTPISPGKAAGLLFVPLFNFYWVFRAIGGYAKEYNGYRDRRGDDGPPLRGDLFMTYCVLSLLGIVPIVGYVTAVLALIVQLVLAAKICDAVNALGDDDATVVE